MSRRNRPRRDSGVAPVAAPSDAEPLEVSEPTIHALAVYADGIGWREVRLVLPIEVVQEYAVESRDPDHAGVVGMRAYEWVEQLAAGRR